MILVTGGTGFIGSHTIIELIQSGKEVVIMDNLSNSSLAPLEAIYSLTGVRPIFYQYDLRNKQELEDIFQRHHIDSVIHFAGLKAVGESVRLPFHYYQNNVVGSINLFQTMAEHGCNNIVFSSSCTVYGDNPNAPFDENTPKQPCTNPYGRSKSVLEDLLLGLSQSIGLKVANLRYFNPIGAHQSGQLGENPNDIPNNLLPYVMRTASGLYPTLKVFGNDYPTPDGTGIRDYIHVVDLAQAHLKALKWLGNQENGCFDSFNIGTGSGTSVLEIIAITEEVTHRSIPYEIVPRRPGDIATAYANPHKAKTMLGREAHYTVKQAIFDMRNYQNQLTNTNC